MGHPEEGEICRQKRRESLKAFYCQMLTLGCMSFCCLAVGIATVYYGVKTERPLFIPVIPGVLGIICLVIGMVFHRKAQNDTENALPTANTKCWISVYYGSVLFTCIASFNMLNPLVQIWQRCDSTKCDTYETEIMIVSIMGIVFVCLVGLASMIGAFLFGSYARAYGFRHRCCWGKGYNCN